MQNLGMGGTPSDVGPVGPGAGRELMLLYVGRVLLLSLGLELLRPFLAG